MACTRRRSELIAKLAWGRIDDAHARELIGHVEQCESCSEELDAAADFAAAREHIVADSVVPGAVASGSLHGQPDRVEREEPKPAPRAEPPRRRLEIWPPALAVVASVAIFFAVWAVLPDGGPERASNPVDELAVLDPAPAPTDMSEALPAAEAALFERAMESYTKGDFTDAIRRIESVVRVVPEHAVANLYLGIARLQTRDRWGAIEPLSRAASSRDADLRDAGIWYLANAYLVLGDPDRALDLLERLDRPGGEYAARAGDLGDSIEGVLGR